MERHRDLPRLVVLRILFPDGDHAAGKIEIRDREREHFVSSQACIDGDDKGRLQTLARAGALRHERGVLAEVRKAFPPVFGLPVNEFIRKGIFSDQRVRGDHYRKQSSIAETGSNCRKPIKKRTLGIAEGQVWIADDFNESNDEWMEEWDKQPV